jgi:hypothetical protein
LLHIINKFNELTKISVLIAGLATIQPGVRAQEAPAVPRGGIKGVVLDAEVKTPLAGVRVKVLGGTLESVPGLEAVTDSQGRYEIAAVPVGSYVLEFSFPYFRTRRITDIIVKSGRATPVEAEINLDNAAVDKREVTVTAAYFDEPSEAAPSTTGFSFEEIRRAAGAAGDVTRMIGSLPSVARTNDTMNHLIVRGGSPTENAFYIDNIEIPNINHYPQQGASSGPIGLLNVEFIRDVSFSAGGFSPIFGDRLSSVMDISFREGNRDASELQLDLSMMGLGLVAEGPLPARKGSWLVSARRSYIDLLIRLMGSGVPVSWSDGQAKVVLDLSPRNRLAFLAVAGLDDSGTHKADAIKDAESTFGELDTSEYTAGFDWFHQWGSSGYSNTSLARSEIRYRESFQDTLSEELLRKATNGDEAWTLRNVNLLRLGGSERIVFGFEAKRLLSRFDSFEAGTTDVLGQPVPGLTRRASVSTDLYSGYAQYGWDPVRSLTVQLGFRADRFASSRALRLSPRLSLAWRVSSRDTLDASAGVFYQQLPATLLVQREAAAALLEPRALHFILGYRRLLAPDTRLSVEVYDKEYDRMPLDPTQPALFLLDEIFRDNRFAEHGPLVFGGRARSAGVEVLVQKKLADRLYGIASLSYFRTRYLGYDGRWYDRVYDNRFLFCVEGGWRLGRSWELGLRANYAGGAPYTPFDLAASQAANAAIFDPSRINGARLPAYASFNVRADRRFNFRGSNLTVYLSLWNILDRKNVAAVYWNAIGRKPGEILGWGVLPVLGVEFEF